MVLCSCRTLVSLWASEFLRPWNSFDRLRSSASVCSSLDWDRTRWDNEEKEQQSVASGGIKMDGVLITCRALLSLSSSFLWAPALFALSFILQRYRHFNTNIHKDRRKKERPSYLSTSVSLSTVRWVSVLMSSSNSLIRTRLTSVVSSNVLFSRASNSTKSCSS